ncbi:hypothetical protein HYQ46_013000 [Verticillium longisporum]|nr:hypothetical protein HYQ46_013000 [Verticillium longisporum]
MNLHSSLPSEVYGKQPCYTHVAGPESFPPRSDMSLAKTKDAMMLLGYEFFERGGLLQVWNGLTGPGFCWRDLRGRQSLTWPASPLEAEQLTWLIARPCRTLRTPPRPTALDWVSVIILVPGGQELRKVPGRKE